MSLPLRSPAALALAIPAFVMGMVGCADNRESTPSDGAGTPAVGIGSEPRSRVKVYSSLPLQGSSRGRSNAIVGGIKLALEEAGGKAGSVAVVYESLDDSTSPATGWQPDQVASNARTVAQDNQAIAYIGDLDSGATQVSLPILNTVGLAQISPGSTYVGLTVDEPGATQGEPAKYRPSGAKSLVRIVPRDTIQAAALVSQATSDRCTRIAIANDRGTYGAGLRRLVELEASQAGATVVADTPIEDGATDFRDFASELEAVGADCFIFAGDTSDAAVRLFEDVAAKLPDARLYGGDGVCESAFTDPEKGISARVAERFVCTVATPDLDSSVAGRRFAAAFAAKYGDGPRDPYAVYGFEAMQLVLDSIEASGAAGTTRDGFLAQVRKTTNRDSVLGRYSIDANGDTTRTDYSLYRVGKGGSPVYEANIKAAE